MKSSKTVFAGALLALMSANVQAGYPGNEMPILNPPKVVKADSGIMQDVNQAKPLTNVAAAVDNDLANIQAEQERRDAKMIESALLPDNLEKLPRVKPNSWVINKGERLSTVIERWSKIEGWTLVWAAELDPVMAASVEYKGTYKDSIVEVFKTLAANGGHFQLDLYKLNNVARVTMLNASQASTLK
jgi:hypothetical protein